MEIQALKVVDILKPLSESELHQVAQVTLEKRAPKGSTLLLAEDPGQNVFLLLEGEAKVTMIGDDGREFVLILLEEGDIFGELSLLTGEHRSANVVAVTECRLGLISKLDFLSLLERSPQLSLSLLKTLAGRLRQSSLKLGEFALLDVTDRVKQTLLGLAELSKESSLPVVKKRPTHVMLASMVGTSREMVTRALGLLEETGELKLEGKTVYFLKP
jgi:CRP/FNR family cyclic AMP-dependent transcriptional regulator